MIHHTPRFFFQVTLLISCLLISTLLISQHRADSIITKLSLQETVAVLASDSLEGRMTGSEGSTKATFFIEQKMITAGLQPLPGLRTLLDSFPVWSYRKKISGVNVIGFLPAILPTDSMVVFSAHYDHLGKGKDFDLNSETTADDEIFNGANDNATGVAALLELAKYYSANRLNRYNVLFIAFSGEEMGLIGSTEYVKKTDTRSIKTVINLEMLGRPTNGRCYVVSIGNSKIRNYLNKNLEASSGKKGEKFFGADTYHDEQLEYRSDHYPFSRKVKTSFTIMASSPSDEYYHSVDDEFGTIDFDFLLKATRNIALASEYFLR